jgi:hypothetical protein
MTQLRFTIEIDWQCDNFQYWEAWGLIRST